MAKIGEGGVMDGVGVSDGSSGIDGKAG